MNILAIDTSMQACSAAILHKDAGGKVCVSGCYEEIERGHAERLMGMIDEVLKTSGLSIKQVDQFAVCRGPGTFTGVRIGIATARGLALACKKPLIGIGTLQILAARVLREPKERQNLPASDPLETELGIAIDARRGEIYWQQFDPGGQALDEPLALPPQTIASLIERQGKPLRLAGSGAELIAKQCSKKMLKPVCSHPGLQPNAADLSKLVANLSEKELLIEQSTSPLYLRPADAKVQSGYAVERQ